MTYSIGIDFGTGSGRVLIVNTKTGDVAGMSVVTYSEENVKANLGNKSIPLSFSLQDAADYMEVLEKGIPQALEEAGVDQEQIVGLGIDFTSSTVVVADDQLNPLSYQPKFQDQPHAYVKLWKHHGAGKEAEQMFDVARDNHNRWLGNYGYNVSSEWMIPKVLELIHQAPDILANTTYIMEAGDWVISKLINENVRSNCARGFKTFWNEEEGFFYDYYEKVDSQLPTVIQEKLEGRLVKIGEQAGALSPEMSTALGLPADLPIAPAIIDAHASLLGIGSERKNQLTMVMGTSTCHLMLHDEQKQIPGISGSVKDAIIPGLYAYEAGQSAVGDLFEYAVNQAPAAYTQEAFERNISVHELLEEKASVKKPGESGLVALDWHNGNRSVLSDSDLSGLLIGETLHTKTEDIYRAYMEATAFGTKMIMTSYEDWGMQIDDIFAGGGLPQKNELLMQIYADILNRPIHISASDYAPAIGAAILGSVVGGTHSTVAEAVQAIKQPVLKTVYPISENVATYERLFKIYQEMHDFFGFERINIMKDLQRL